LRQAGHLKWEIHNLTHDMYAAERAKDFARMRAKRGAIRALERDFLNRFTKKL